VSCGLKLGMVFRRSYFLLFSSLENGLLINIENLKPLSNVLRKLKQFLGSCDHFWDSFDKGHQILGQA